MSFKKGDLVEITNGNFKGFVLEVLNLENGIACLGNKELGSIEVIQEEYIKPYKLQTQKVEIDNKELVGKIKKLMTLNSIMNDSLSDIVESAIEDEEYRESDEIIIDMKYIRKRLEINSRTQKALEVLLYGEELNK